MEDLQERDQYVPGDFDEELWPEPPASAAEAEELLTLAETPGEWPPQEQQFQPDDEGLLPADPVQLETEAEAAVEEWTAGMVRPPLDAEARELEDEPIEPISRPGLKSEAEAETEAKYGI